MKESTNLDVLRAFAVLMVVFEHVLVTFKVTDIGCISVYNFGKIGVFIFFVHTCLVLMYSLQRTDGTSFASLSFYIRRFFRLYPLAIVCILIVIILRIPPNPWGTEYQWCGIPVLLSNLFLVQNLFTPSHECIIGQLWTIPLEIQMYVVLPFLYWFVSRINSIPKFAVLYMVSVLVALVQPIISYRLNFFSYVPCFLGGVIAFLLSIKKYRLLGKLDSRLWPVGVLFVSLVYILLEGVMHSQIYRGWILGLLLGFIIPFFKELKPNFIIRTGHYIAKYSYGIYLTHVAIIWFSFIVLKNHSPFIRWITFFSMLITLPVILFHTVEHPMIKFGQSFVKNLQYKLLQKFSPEYNTSDNT